jgi:hypothetical protein
VDGALRSIMAMNALHDTVPPNTSALVDVPVLSQIETSKASGTVDVHYVGYQDGRQVYGIGAGNATFVPDRIPSEN